MKDAFRVENYSHTSNMYELKYTIIVNREDRSEYWNRICEYENQLIFLRHAYLGI